jgi:peptide/nickel transport system substrate-binding protein
MDRKILDSALQDGGAMEVDLIEAYADGRINRRNFVKRGAIVGLSVPFMGSIIAACGGSDDESGDSDEGDDASAAFDGTTATDPDAPSGGDIVVGITAGGTTGLDPVNMLDLGTYSVVSQSFEYLVGVGGDDQIGATALATEWSPNDDGSVWTFKLRDGVTWQASGDPFTSADVAATIDRMVAVGAGITGATVSTPDDLTAVVTLESPDGNLPVLLSLFNPQSLITPVDYVSETKLDERPDGTGAWMLEDFDATSFRAKFVPNPNWWGGSVKLDSVTLQGFESGGTRVAAFAAGEIDIIQDFSVTDGSTLLDDDSITVLRPPSSNHRQLWFNTQLPEDGPFTNPLVRQAVCYGINREQLVNTVYQGQAIIANDHPVFPALPFFDDTLDQRPFDPEKAKELLAEAGYPDGFEATLQVGDIAEVPALARIVEQNLADIGITAPVNVSVNSDFYGAFWCTGASYGTEPETSGPGRPCGASASIGIVDYGHRPVPDIFFARALRTDGDWNSSNYASDEFDTLFKDYQGAVDVDGQKTAIAGIQRLLQEDAPACYPIFFNYLSAHSNNVAGFQTTALGHLLLQETTLKA